ncbi:hypothetical protein [Bosea sp. 117]|uniref:hypothetical protein n=1 Tax=Bosea sp. 117 TaxID=1125973 RepID=UPI0004946EE7|nr:hypothetical protein [Bosea sp. 117]
MASDDPADDPKHAPASHDPAAGAPQRDSASGRFKRRAPPTIDLAATDVTPRDPAPDAATEDSPPDKAEGGSEAMAAEAGETAEPTPAGIAGAEAPSSSPPETPERRPMGFFAVLLAALLSGLIGGGFAFAVASSFYGAAENIDAITDVEARVVDLRQRIEVLESRQASVPPADVGPLKAQIAELEKKIVAVETAATSAPAPAAPAASPELMERIAAAEALAKQANTDASRPAASPEALTELGAKVAGLEQRIEAAAKAGEDKARGAAQLGALAALRGAIASAAPFEVELGAARSLLGPAGAALAPLQASAASGLPNGPQLAERLRAAFAPQAAPAPAPAAESASPPAGGEEGMFDRLKRSAVGLVSVKRVAEAPVAGAVTPAQVGTAEAALARGDFDAALASLKSLPEAEAAPAAPIVAAIEARQSALAAVATLDRQVLAGLGATP